MAMFAGGGGTAARTATPASPVSGTGAQGSRREVSSTALSATQIYKRDSTGVVSIKATSPRGEDSGTGIVVNNEGLILTNDHVVAGATSLTVSIGGSNGVTRSATLVGEEANKDLALIHVSPSGLGLEPLRLVSSSSVQVGDTVYAIGNPYGLERTLTNGIVSALNREISAPDGATITGAIQTDAALNPGNSGGPLLNEEGEVIGVNSQIASDAASVGGSQPGSTGVGFAISSNTAAQVIKAIEAGRGVSSSSGRQRSAGAQEGEGSVEGSPYARRHRYEGPAGRAFDEAESEAGEGSQSLESP